MKNHYRIVPVSMCVASLLFAGCEQAETSATQLKPASQQTPAPATAAAPVQTPPATPDAADALVADRAAAAHRHDGMDVKPAAPPAPISAVQIVKADPAEVDLGEIPTNDSKSGKVKLINTGDTPMTIVSARPSCGCTALKFQPNTIIEPNETIEIDVQLSGGPREMEISGKTITFVVEGQPEVVVTLKGRAISYVKLEPTTLDPDTMPDGKFTLRSIDNEPFKVMSVQPQVINDIDPEAKPEHALYVSWEKYREVGINRQLIVYLDHPKCQNIFVTVNFKPEELMEANKRQQQQQTKDKRALNDPHAAAAMAAEAAAATPVDPDTMLANLIKEGRNADVLAKLQTGLDVNYRDNTGIPLIGLAAKAGNADLLRALLATEQVDINATDNNGRTPLMYAATSRNVDAVHVLLDAGVSPTTRDSLGATALWWAAMQGDANNVQALLDAGADVEIVGTITGWTPLIVAAGFGDPGAIGPLLDAHANIEAMDMLEGATPLIHAARTGQIDSLKSLIKRGANLENTDRNGNTAFLACAKTSGGEADKLKVLIEAGANIHAKDNRGLNALELARKRTDIRAADVIAVLEPLLGGETPAQPNSAPPAAD